MNSWYERRLFSKEVREHFNFPVNEIDRLNKLKTVSYKDFLRAKHIHRKYHWWSYALCKKGYHNLYFLYYTSYEKNTLGHTYGCYACNWSGDIRKGELSI